jgi:hypothetical protein
VRVREPRKCSMTILPSLNRRSHRQSTIRLIGAPDLSTTTSRSGIRQPHHEMLVVPSVQGRRNPVNRGTPVGHPLLAILREEITESWRRTMTPRIEVRLENPAVSWTAQGRFLAASLFCLIVPSPGVASAASASVPSVDIATTCRESEKAITTMFGPGTQQTFDNCMKQENDARAEIVKSWRGYPAGGRQHCVNTTVYMPSYVEWLTCLEMDQSVEALRRNNTAATDPATTAGQGKR